MGTLLVLVLALTGASGTRIRMATGNGTPAAQKDDGGARSPDAHDAMMPDAPFPVCPDPIMSHAGLRSLCRR